MKKTAIHYDLQKTTEIFADIAVTLFSNGANSTRTARNLKRIAPAYHCDVEFYFSHSAIVISLEDLHSKDKFTITKSIPHYHVNYFDMENKKWRNTHRKYRTRIDRDKNHRLLPRMDKDNFRISSYGGFSKIV